MAYNSILYKVRLHSLGMAWFTAQRFKAEHQVSSCVFPSFTIRFFDLCWSSRSQSTPLSSGGPSSRSGPLVPISVCICVGHGVVDPVQDDEAHAADHDQEAAQQEGGSLERGTVFTVRRLQASKGQLDNWDSFLRVTAEDLCSLAQAKTWLRSTLLRNQDNFNCLWCIQTAFW